MPAFPAGLRNSPADSEAATTSGLFQKIIGTASGAKLQAMTTVSAPVRYRSMSHGATTAPSTPNSPAAVSTSPIWTGAKPPSIRRRTATKNNAFTSRLTSADQTIRTRKSGLRTMNRNPSPRLSRSRGAGPVAGDERSARIRPSRTHETA